MQLRRQCWHAATCRPVVVQPKAAEGLLAELLAGFTQVVNGVSPIASACPQDTCLQPILWRVLRRCADAASEYHGPGATAGSALRRRGGKPAAPGRRTASAASAGSALRGACGAGLGAGIVLHRRACGSGSLPALTAVATVAVLEAGLGHQGFVLMDMFKLQGIKARILDEAEERCARCWSMWA